MASICVEEENYVRMSLLLTGISPRASRTFFDSEFAPACLDATMKKEKNKLLDLKKKHRINQSQWNLLFPRFPGLPDSKTFDISLMIALLRNLTPLTPPLCGFDRLPSAMETTPTADLARIKHYRNYLAHLEEGKIDTTFYNTAWADVTDAVNRLGGQQMKQECDHLKTKPLDQTNQEIMMDIKRSNDEIMGLKKSFKSLKRSHTDMKKSNKLLQEDHIKVQKSNEMLQVNYKKVKKSHKMLQEDHKTVTKEMEIIKTSQQETVPWNIRAINEEMLKNWKDNDDTMFIKTRAAEHVLKCIKENSCVTITASSGVGKTATIRHVALQMVNEEYDVILLTEPVDIVNYHNPNKKMLFVFDDLCGNFSVDQSDIKNWDRVMKNIKEVLEKNQTKILAACRFQVYLDEKFESLSIFKSCVCNLLSDTICLSKTEKQSIAELYLKTKASEITDYCNFYDCYPLLCKLYHDNPKRNIIDFFQNPFSVFEAEIINLKKKGHPTKYCTLALCVMFNNTLEKEIFTQEVDEETKTIIENTCEACMLDRGTSRLVLQNGLESLKDTYITQEKNVYKILHDKIFDFIAYHFGQKIILCLIKNADSGLIRERFLLEKKDDMDQFITIIPGEYHEMYIKRMIDDWSNGKVHDVFSNINMKIPQFRQKFLSHLKTLDKSCQRQLAHICDKHKPKSYSNFYSYIDQTANEHYDTALFRSCYIGDILMVMWCCDHEVDVNTCTYTGLTPVMIACKYGHTKIANMLLDRGLDCNKCDSFNQSMIMQACKHGRTEIVKMLLVRGADCNKCDCDGMTPVMKACEDGHKEIVQMLLDNGAELDKCDKNGQSAVMKACKHGHTDIVKILLDSGAESNACDRNEQSPLMTACEYGHTEIVKMLLDEGADCNACTWRGQSSILKACRHGPTEIVKMLLNRGADCYKCDDNGQSPLMMASEEGHTEIVKMLLDRGVELSTCDRSSESPVMKACAHGHTEIVTMLLDRGADFHASDWSGQSAIIKASGEGHTEIVKMLLDRGADCNKCDKYGQSALMKASEEGHTEIVKMLLDRGDDCNTCDGSGQSSVMNMTGVSSHL